MDFVQRRPDGSLSLAVFVQPRSSRNRIAGVHDGALKIALTAPPVDGKANRAVVVFVAKFFGLPRSNVSLLQGASSRSKLLVLTGIGLDAARRLLAEVLGDPV